MLNLLETFRSAAYAKYSEIGLKIESLQYVKQLPILLEPALPESKLEPKEAIVFVNGYYEESLSQIQEEIVCLPLEKALLSYGVFLQGKLQKSLKEEKDPLAFLNGALFGRAAFVYIPPNANVKLDILYHNQSPGLSAPRLYVYAGRGAQVTLLQNFAGEGESNSFLDITADAGANVFVQQQGNAHITSIRAQVKRDAAFKAVLLNSMLRTGFEAKLLEENSAVELYCLSRLQDSKEAHVHALIEHVAPHTTSRQHIKSVLQDRSRFSFEGKIYVHKEAQKTQGYQLNNTLILSDEASSFAKPNLEIFADDVKASHGSTTGKLDEEALFYMRSRGVGLEEAKKLLLEGFCKEILDHAR